MERRKASVISRPKSSVGLASRCCCMRAWYLYLCRTSRQLRRGPTGRISKSSNGSGGGGGGVRPTITPPGGKEGPSEDAPVDRDFDISMYGSKAGWKIQSSSSLKNAWSHDLLVPTGTGLRPRHRLRRGITCRGERTGERDRLRRGITCRGERTGERDRLRRETRWCGCEVNMTVSRLAMKMTQWYTCTTYLT